MAKNRLGRSRFNPGCLVVCQQVREGIARGTSICGKALQEHLDDSPPACGSCQRCQQGLDLQLQFGASRDEEETRWVGKGLGQFGNRSR